MREENRKIVRDRLKAVINDLAKDGLSEDEVLEELNLDLVLDEPQGLYLQATFDYGSSPEKRVSFKELIREMINLSDYVREDHSPQLRQVAAELEELAKVCAEAAERHAVSGLPLLGKG